MAKDWMSKGLCSIQSVDTEWFFDDYLRYRDVFDFVNDLCARCAVRQICLRYGKKTKSMGVWGGKWLEFGVEVEVEFEDAQTVEMDDWA